MEELQQRLADDKKVVIAFGGNSMHPMIDGAGDVVELVPLTEPLRCGEVYLFVCNNHFVVHRLMRLSDNFCHFRGDNCLNEETVTKDAVVARLYAVIHEDGTREECDSLAWRRRSRRVCALRSLRNVFAKALSRDNRKWERWAYFVLLTLFMWAPIGVIGVPLNNFVLGIRLDHLLHASVYIPCTFFLMDFPLFNRRRSFLLWLAGTAIGLLTESVQYLLPYRGFDINDLIANTIGVTMGFLAVLLYRKHRSL